MNNHTSGPGTATPQKLATLSELARMANNCMVTTKRRLDQNNIQPDALLLQGNRRPFPLYDVSRPEVLRLLAIRADEANASPQSAA